MMPQSISRFYLILILISIAFFTALLLIIPRLPYDDHGLRQLLFPEGCPAPCLMGIRPGVMTMDEAVAILQANPWVGQVEKETSGFSDTIQWIWNNRIPKSIIPTSEGQLIPTQNSEKPLVDTVMIVNFLQLGEVYAALGQPDTETMNLAGYSIGEKYAYIDYTALYKKENLFLFYEQACRTGYMSTDKGETLGVPFTTPVYLIIGGRITLPISGQPIPARSPIHLHRACGA